jgi:primosomal protein N' (replication factor Y)
LRCTSPNSNNCLNFLNKAHQILKSKNKLNAIGPLPSIPSKVKGNSRFHLVLQSSTKTYLNRVLKFLINEFENWPEAKKIKWSFDIDPYDMS